MFSDHFSWQSGQAKTLTDSSPKDFSMNGNRKYLLKRDTIHSFYITLTSFILNDRKSQVTHTFPETLRVPISELLRATHSPQTLKSDSPLELSIILNALLRLQRRWWCLNKLGRSTMVMKQLIFFAIDGTRLKSHQHVQKSICLKCVCIYRAVNTSSRFLSFIITLSFYTLHYELPFPKIAFKVWYQC